MKRICVDSFIVEVGRMCNRVCEHCLRGKMEDVSISLDNVKRVLRQVDRINTIVFTGGEPTLYSKEIVKIIRYIIKNNIDVGGFYIASNGEVYSPELMAALVDLYAYADVCPDECGTAFEVSDDQFHTPNRDVVKKLKSFAFYSERSNIDERYIIDEGYASENGIGCSENAFKNQFGVTLDEYNDGNDEYTFEQLYLNALGYMYSGCNYSYETQREHEDIHCKNMTLRQLVSSDFVHIY